MLASGPLLKLCFFACSMGDLLDKFLHTTLHARLWIVSRVLMCRDRHCGMGCGASWTTRGCSHGCSWLQSGSHFCINSQLQGQQHHVGRLKPAMPPKRSVFPPPNSPERWLFIISPARRSLCQVSNVLLLPSGWWSTLSRSRCGFPWHPYDVIFWSSALEQSPKE